MSCVSPIVMEVFHRSGIKRSGMIRRFGQRHKLRSTTLSINLQGTRQLVPLNSNQYSREKREHNNFFPVRCTDHGSNTWTLRDRQAQLKLKLNQEKEVQDKYQETPVDATRIMTEYTVPSNLKQAYTGIPI